MFAPTHPHRTESHQTYCANVQVADSACTATAYLAGVKANYGTIGLSAAATLGDCYAQNNTDFHVQSIAKWAQDYGMATGMYHTYILHMYSRTGAEGKIKPFLIQIELRQSFIRPNPIQFCVYVLTFFFFARASSDARFISH